MMMASRGAALLRSLNRRSRRLSAATGQLLPPGASYHEEFLTERQHDALVAVIEKRLGRRRYEKDHWDSVIVNYREGEVPERFFGGAAREALEETRRFLADAHGVAAFLTPHAIDLADAGSAISAHVDSVKFSGGVVAGLSLLSPATMELAEADDATGEPRPGGARYDLRLAPRSLYVLAGDARFAHAHAVGDLAGRRLSLIFRDAKDEAG